MTIQGGLGELVHRKKRGTGWDVEPASPHRLTTHAG